MVILLKLASVVSPLGKTLCWKRLRVEPKRIAHSVSPAMFHQVTLRFGHLYAYAGRHGNRHTHPYVFFFLFIFIPVTHQYAVSFCPAPSSDCLFALSLSSRLTPTLDQQHPVSLFIKCLFLQSAGFPFTECPLCRFPCMPRSTHMLVIIHILSQAWFLGYVKDLSFNLHHHVAPSII